MTATQEAPATRDRSRPAPQGGPAADHRPHAVDRQPHAARACCTWRWCAARSRTPTITGIDTEAARQAPNVVAVITGADLGDEQGSASTPGRSRPDQKSPPSHVPMPADRVAFAGEIVAVVVARSAAEARDAAELVDVEYDELPAALDLKEARRRTRVLAHPDLGTNKSALLVSSTPPTPAPAATSRTPSSKARDDGIVIEREYRQQRLIPAFMEPRSRRGRPDRRAADACGRLDPDPAHPAVRPRRDHRGRRSRRSGSSPPTSAAASAASSRPRPRSSSPGPWPAGSASRCKYTETRSESLMAGAPRPGPVAAADAGGREGRHRHRPQGRPARRPRGLRLARRWRRAGARCVHVQRDLQVPRLPVRLPDGSDQQDAGPTPTAAPAGRRRRTRSSG